MNINNQCKILIGPWINQNTPVFVFISFLKNVEYNKILIETYILIPKKKKGYELLIFEPVITNSSDEACLDRINQATNLIKDELKKLIPPNNRDRFPDLFPYKLEEIKEPISEIKDYYNVINHEKLIQKFIFCLEQIKKDTKCNNLEDLLSNLIEKFK